MADKQKENLDRRRFPRVMAPIFYRAPRLITLKRRVSNISIGGVRIYSDERFEVGKRMEVELFMPGDFSITATARVVWIDELPPDADARFDVGLQFMDLAPEAMEQLKAVLED